MNYKLWELLE